MPTLQQHYDLQAASEELMGLPATFRAPSSIDSWRHVRMLDLTMPLWKSDPSATWMTVGDGRYGSDAAYLHSRGITVTATSLTSERLGKAAEMGYIQAFRSENAEAISAAANSFDYVLCKEAYHHFPRPPIALYEMLRVARRAVVLIEPLDDVHLLDGAKRLVKRLLRGNASQEFEPAGNYLYRLKVHEIEKLMLAMGGEVVAFKGINDFYHRRLAQHEMTQYGLPSLIVRLGVAVQNLLARLGLLGYGLGCIVIFKSAATDVEVRSLASSGFKVRHLAKNPYATQ
jgi:SAM-dependent methyltransferase